MFQFKEFYVQQDKCAMKVGTDGVLLGAWTPIDHNPYTILDIGSGTGVIALMLAQRTSSEQIDGIEIDEDAYEQCVNNFENSKWNDRLFCYHAALDEFTEEVFGELEYDLIVSNPPFYSENYSSGNEKRDQARFQEALPFEQLLQCADALLTDNGVFSVIIPFKEQETFISIARGFELYPFKITLVKGTPQNDIKRSLLAFSRILAEPKVNELTIETERHHYTKEYQSLTKDFYLKF